ncbi:MAG: hypothetical protein LBH32_13885 [Dysgonamonadaceae bacterium]|jgi:hypothetical protein|nr:hypothetical protein [Dysgonamonadaceae bacterium]
MFSQNNIDKIKEFYTNADTECYIDLYQREDYFLQKVDLQKGKTIFILNVQFANTESYRYSDDICNYLIVDSSRVFTIASVDKSLKLKFLSGLDGQDSFYDKNDIKRISNLKQAIKNIYKETPELILFCRNLCGKPIFTFMFVKENRVYIYRVQDGKIMELNEYIRENYKLESVRLFNMIIRPYNYKNNSKNRNRLAGHTSLNELRICSPVSVITVDD